MLHKACECLGDNLTFWWARKASKSFTFKSLDLNAKTCHLNGDDAGSRSSKNAKMIRQEWN